MGLKQVKEEILRTAQSSAKQILAQGRSEVALLQKQQQENIQAKSKDALAHTALLLDVLERKELSTARFEANKLLSSTKQKMLDEVFEAVAKELRSAGALKRKALFAKALAQAEKELDIATIYCAKQDKGFAGKYAVQEEDLVGGFIAENKEGTVRVDSRFEAALGRIKELRTKQIADALFGEK